jgi:hypothetical protein
MSGSGPALNISGAFRNGDNEIRLGDQLRSVCCDPASAAPRSCRAGVARDSSAHSAARTAGGRVLAAFIDQRPQSRVTSIVGYSHGATVGETLVVAFGLEESTLDVERIGAEVAGVAGLRRLLVAPCKPPRRWPRLDCREGRGGRSPAPPRR